MTEVTCVYGGDRSVCSKAITMYASNAVRVIPTREFSSWANLNVIDFSNATEIVTIQLQAFYACQNIHTLLLPPNVESIGESAFESCTGITELHLPASVKELSLRCFHACNGLHSLSAEPDIKVTNLGQLIFSLTQLSTFDIWPCLVSINSESFVGTPLMNYTNNLANPNYDVVDGILLKGTTLTSFPGGITGSFAIPNFVTALSFSAFAGTCLTNVSFAPHSKMTTFGACSFGSSKTLENFEFPDSPDCTSIATSMFSESSQLTTLTLTRYITSIGQGAFSYTRLSKIVLPDDHPSFVLKDEMVYSKDLTILWCCPRALAILHYAIPNTVQIIKPTAFDQVSFSISFEPGSQLSEIGTRAFWGLNQRVFEFDVDCPLKDIPSGVFASLTIEQITLPRFLTSVHGDAFKGTKISHFDMPSDATAMTAIDGVLYSKDNTTLYRFPPQKSGDYRVPQSVVTIGTSAFASCKLIYELMFEHDSKLERVQTKAFESSSLTSIVFPQNGESVVIDNECFTGSSVTSVTLPGRMKVVPSQMFNGCSSLIEIKLPDTLERIGSNAFMNCESLSKLEISQYASLREIEDEAFAGARSLEFLTLPYLVSSISPYALPPNVKHVTLHCPPTKNIADSLSWLLFLKQIDLLCGHHIDTTGFASQNVQLTHICETVHKSKRFSLRFFLIPHILS